MRKQLSDVNFMIKGINKYYQNTDNVTVLSKLQEYKLQQQQLKTLLKPKKKDIDIIVEKLNEKFNNPENKNINKTLNKTQQK